MPITPQDYNDDAIKGAQLERLMEKEIRDRLKGGVPETLAHALCVMAAEIDTLKAALAAHNLGERVADSLDAQTLKVGSVDVADSLASKQARIGSKGGPSQPVYFDSNGNVQEIPVATGKTWLTLYVANANYSNSAGVANDYNATTGSIKAKFAEKQDSLPLTTDDPQDVVYNIRVAGARYANTAGRATSAASADEANTANLAGKANALNVNAAVGSGILPVYIGANGVPVACNVTTDDPQDVVANFRVAGARTADKLSYSGGSVSQPVYFPAANDPYNPTLAGKPVPIPLTNVTIDGVSFTFVTIQAYGAYAAKKLDANAGGPHQPVYFYNGLPVAIDIIQHDNVNYIDMAASSAYQATVALNAAAVNGKKIVIGGYGGAADTIYFG